LYNVENETTILPTFIAIKKMNSTTNTNRCSRNDPIFTFTSKYSIVFEVIIKQPYAKIEYTIPDPTLLTNAEKLKGEFTLRKIKIL